MAVGLVKAPAGGNSLLVLAIVDCLWKLLSWALDGVTFQLVMFSIKLQRDDSLACFQSSCVSVLLIGQSKRECWDIIICMWHFPKSLSLGAPIEEMDRPLVKRNSSHTSLAHNINNLALSYLYTPLPEDDFLLD